MLNHLCAAGVCLVLALSLSACASKSEVVAMQPAQPTPRPQIVTHTTTIPVKKVAPSPWATDAVSAYDQNNN